LRKDGTVLYSGKDLALAEKKFNEFKIERSIYTVSTEQTMHFKQLFKTLELMGFKHATKCAHVAYNEVRLPTGKMSSRTGQNILYSDFKQEIIDQAAKGIQTRHETNPEELKHRAQAIAIAAIKYTMLRPDSNQYIIFDKEQALRFEGNTGPYLLYSYARAKSILRKANKKLPAKLSFPELSDKEKILVSKFAQFPEVVRNAYNSLAPNLIANYAFELAQLFNEFYHAEQVIGSDKEIFRLVLVESFAQVLANALYLLGITPIENM
jgi:arginyl-tRNA synthetase